MTSTVLIRNEWIKTTKRLAFWVTLLCLGGLVSIMALDRRMSGLASEKVPLFQLPDGWSFIIGEPGPLPGMFAAVLMILLVANEFSWRTARQNVIDGLSREQFYAGKTLLLPGISLGVALLVVGIGAGVALLGTELGSLSGPLASSHDLALLGGGVLSILGMGAVGLLLAATVRGGGPAIALFFLYMGFGERLMALLVNRLLPALVPLLPYRPVELFMSLVRSDNYYPAAQEAAIASALEHGREAPTFLDPGTMAAVAAGWIALFLLVGFLTFRRRDL